MKLSHKHIRIVIIFLLFFLLLFSLRAQNFRDQFDQFKQGQQSNYNQFVEQVDKEFADFLRQNWQTFQLHKGHQIKKKPKPSEFPTIREFPNEQKELPGKPSERNVELQEEFVMPVNHKTRSFGSKLNRTSFEFYGDDVAIQFDTRIKSIDLIDVSENAIAEFWEIISQTDYRPTLDDLLAYQGKYAINDFGIYLLIKKFSNSIFQSQAESRLLTWFLLSKAKLKVKIGYVGNDVFLLLPCKRKVYGLPYFIENNIPYYVMDFTGGSLKSYAKDYPGSYSTMDFSIDKAMKLASDEASKPLDFNFNNQSYSFQIGYNRNAIDFYNEVPQIELSGYFDSQLTEQTCESLKQVLSPVLADLGDVESVGFLLSLVQNGFGYKIDQEQFGQEKSFFPEEILHYPFSDCEDRSVFFAYLVQTLLGNDVIGLDYPEHVATAVNFSSEVKGDFVMHKGQKYVVCDPTYTNAPVGISMRDLSEFEAKVISSNTSDQSYFTIEYWKELLGINGDIVKPLYIERQSGKYICSNFNQSVEIQGKMISASKPSVFLASFDHTNELNWIKKVELSPNSELLSWILDVDDKPIILTLTDGQYQLTKYSATGMFEWSSDIPDMKSSVPESNVDLYVYDKNGDLLAGKSYLETEYYQPVNLAIRNDNILIVLAAP